METELGGGAAEMWGGKGGPSPAVENWSMSQGMGGLQSQRQPAGRAQGGDHCLLLCLGARGPEAGEGMLQGQT